MKLKNRNHKMTSDIQLLRLAFNGGLELVGESILEEVHIHSTIVGKNLANHPFYILDARTWRGSRGCLGR